jgi:diaminopimelate epimerase
MVEFYKYHGAGNDFILIDNRSKVFNPDKKIIKNLCRRHLGVGADGLILLEDDSLSGYMMRYFNSDGKEASMCGNGGRCFVAFAQSLGLCNDHFIFNAIDGYHEAIILKRDKDSYLVNLKMNDVSTVLPYDEGFYLDTGSPHLVVFTNYINKIDVFKTGKELRLLPKWGADGVNVNFAQIENNKIISRTYERGVENETLAVEQTFIKAVFMAPEFFLQWVQTSRESLSERLPKPDITLFVLKIPDRNTLSKSTTGLLELNLLIVPVLIL